jgi:predicted transcriptional regulator
MSEIDSILSILENPTRRRILRRLTVETHYPLQLAKELKISPQAVMKHLEVLERNGLVQCQRLESSRGPSRKCYTAVRHISLRLEMSPNLFETRIHDLSLDESKASARQRQEIDDPSRELLDLQRKLKEINREIRDRDRELIELVRAKETHLDMANRIIRQFFEDYEEREIVHYILSHENFDLSGLSESLGLREERIRRVLRRLSEVGLLAPREVK